MLRFKLGPFPVAIEPMFWLTALLLGGLDFADVPRTLVWVAVVFVSVLIHELGHAIVARAIGGRPEIVLRAFGGVTLPKMVQKPRALLRLLLAVAGPAFGLSLYFVALALEGRIDPDLRLAQLAIFYLKWTSIAWTVLNLLPILDLDGGHALQAVLEGIRKRPSRRVTAQISIGVAVLSAAAAYFVVHDVFVVLFLGLFAARNFAEVTQTAQREVVLPQSGPTPTEQDDVRRMTEVARRALQTGDDSGALAAAELLERSEGAFRQAAGLRIRAGVLLGAGRNAEAGLVAGRSFSVYPLPDAAIVAARANLRASDRGTALVWLKRALEAGAPAAAIQADGELGALVAAPTPAG